MDSNKMKKQKTVELASSDECDIAVEYLNDDCLLHIFQYLTAAEKINAETVCKNWNRVLKMSWSDVKSLNLHTILPFRFTHNINAQSKAKNTAYLINILKRRGNYLQELQISGFILVPILNLQAVYDIPKYCSNITEIDLKLADRHFLKDEDLKNLFSKNPKINSISFRNFILTGECLMNLDAKQIKKLRLENGKFESEGYFYGFIANLKNLNVLKIYDEVEELNLIMDALIISNIENLSEIQLISYQKSYVRNLSLLLSRQKKIQKLELENILFDQSFMEKLPIQSLEYLALDFEDNYDEILLVNEQKVDLSLILSKQSKIRIIRLKNVLIDIQLIKSQKTIELTENLEEFYLAFDIPKYGEIVSNLSIILSKLRKLRKLEVEKVKIDEKFMKSIPSEFLEELKLDLSYEGQPVKILLKSLERFQYLQSLKVIFNFLKHDFLETMYKFVNKNLKILEIGFYNYKSSGKQIRNFSRLQNLESLIINNKDDEVVDTSNTLLENILLFENLKKLSINYCNLETSELINCFGSFENLICLNLDFAIIGDEEFIALIEILLYLRELRISFCINVTENFISGASEVKLERGDTHILNIFIRCCNFVNFDVLNDTPLISICEF